MAGDPGNVCPWGPRGCLGPATLERPSAGGDAGREAPQGQMSTQRSRWACVNRLRDRGGGRAGQVLALPLVLQAFPLCPYERVHWSWPFIFHHCNPTRNSPQNIQDSRTHVPKHHQESPKVITPNSRHCPTQLPPRAMASAQKLGKWSIGLCPLLGPP